MSKTIRVSGNGIVWLTIPSQENGMYDIQVLLDCTPSDQNCTLQTSSKVKLTGSVRDVIIRPSSNYYRPGETSKNFHYIRPSISFFFLFFPLRIIQRQHEFQYLTRELPIRKREMLDSILRERLMFIQHRRRVEVRRSKICNS